MTFEYMHAPNTFARETKPIIVYNYNNNKDLLCANTLESRDQWRDQNQGIKQSRNRKQCASRRRMDEGARKSRRTGSINDDGGIKQNFCHRVGAATEKARVQAFVFTRGM